MTGRVHVIGAGLAGLSAATALAMSGRRVALHDAAGHAGGRCRSFHDEQLDRTLDNGNHLLLSGNQAALAFLDRIGARDRLLELRPAAFPFLDLATGDAWCLRPNAGPLPWWLLDRRRRTPGAGLRAHLAGLRLAFAPAGARVADLLDPAGPAFGRLWQPLAVSILNEEPGSGSARLLGAVFRRTLFRGEAACRPMIAARGLSDCFVDPALAYLTRQGATVALHSRLRALRMHGSRVAALEFTSGTIPLAPGDAVVLALPPHQASALLPGLPVPQGGSTILNAHFRLAEPARLPGGLPFLGLVGGTAEWLFARGDVVSVTVSAAGRLADRPAEALAAELWGDVARALGTGGPPPAYRIVKERRATFRQTPGEEARRPGPRTGIENLTLAGDWTATGLPATIEGAILSGARAARATLLPRGTAEAGLIRALRAPAPGISQGA
ncbi:hydroxysqualene dehydroxylase HpnE [Arenibaculum pallidiluteum]|uniref:hydroxysqualene dehydroxylase HpnE n=1 Tax=Arenibaculum pallidiluteum TaxID=2812559 RepID=UPI001A96FBC3|nr:hydroxysqualene dehydroxylase HpnE [Arenibaculum pallidiluteum]